MIIKMPTCIELWKIKKKNRSLNLNTYRNLHYIVANNLKKEYKNIVESRLSSLWKIQIKTPLTLTFIFYNWTKRLSDLDNWLSIQAKFFQDSLVELGYIKDDDYINIVEIVFKYWWYDRGRQRVEIVV